MAFGTALGGAVGSAYQRAKKGGNNRKDISKKDAKKHLKKTMGAVGAGGLGLTIGSGFHKTKKFGKK